MAQIFDALVTRAPELVLFIGFVAAAYALIGRLTLRAEVLGVARSATEDLYAKADELLRDPTLPDDLKGVLYDVLLAVTNDELGKAAFKAISEPNLQPSREFGLKEALDALRQNNPTLADQFFDALRAGMASIVCSHAFSSRQITVTLARNVSERKHLVRTTEQVERRLGEIEFPPRHAAFGAA